MPSQIISSVENNFTKGLVTEFTGLNFPENAATDTENCEYTVVGNVLRRQGINAEVNGLASFIDRTGVSVSSYKWNNAGGDGSTQIVISQVGSTLYFYKSSTATNTVPLSQTKLLSTVDISAFTSISGVFDATSECTYADGNGYLFVYHASCDPFYCTFSGGVVTGTAISIQVRDFAGIPEATPINFRPTTLSVEHQYNLVNQGWVSGNAWSTTSATNTTLILNLKAFTVSAGLVGVVNGQSVNILYNGTDRGLLQGTILLGGTVTSYVGTTLTINCTSHDSYWASLGFVGNQWLIVPTATGYLNSWNTAVGNYPSNADVWWYFKNTSSVFDPATTVSNVSLATGKSPRGHYLLSAFNQQRGLISGISGLTDVTTTVRPTNGTWFQGRVWYTGVNAQQAATGDAPYYTWTSNIYFSQIVTSTADFGACYQVNDPTSENLFGLLPSDGGVISIPEAGTIYKLFPMQNAMLIFAANGVWYMTGTQGIGFAANDYTIVKLSSVKSISTSSYVDIQGLPMFWNEEGIYKVEPAKQGKQLLNSPLHVNPLEVNPVTVTTILDFYSRIPLSSKKYAKAAYHPIDYTAQWIYRSDEAPDVTGRYTYDKILNFNTHNNAFYPYTVDSSTSSINGILYVEGPGGSDTPTPTFKYLYSNGTDMGFAEEYDDNLVDWGSVNYNSYFITGYKLHGQAEHTFQVPYIYVYSNLDGPVSYYIQSLWDYSTSSNSGRWSSQQQVNIFSPNFGKSFRRHRLRGQGLVLQIKISSVDGKPFDIMGWALYETMNQGV